MTLPVTIYISGQCEPNPGPAAYAATLHFAGKQRIISGTLVHATNAQADMRAAIEALRLLESPCEVTVYSCNQAFIKSAAGEWSKSSNLALWAELEEAECTHTVTYRWLLKSDRELAEVRHYAMRKLLAGAVTEGAE